MRTAVWQRSMEHYVLPNLEGVWKIQKGIAYREPFDWLLCYLALRNSPWSSQYTVKFGVQLMAIPRGSLGGPLFRELGRLRGRSMWPAASNVAEAEVAMREILDHAEAQAVPYFEQLGTVEGCLPGARQRVEESPGDPNLQEDIFCLHLINGDVDSAMRAAVAVKDIALVEGHPDWVYEVAARVWHTAEIAEQNLADAQRVLRRNAAITCANLAIEAPGEFSE